MLLMLLRVRYAIRDVRVTAGLTRAVVQDCAEAEDNTDTRDKFFMCVCRVLASTGGAAATCFFSLVTGWRSPSLTYA